MSKIARCAVLVAALMSLLTVMSSAAGAVTWENGGNTSFTATAGVWTLGGTGINLACQDGHAGGTSSAAAFTPTGSNVWSFATGTIAFTSCTVAGSPATVECGFTLTVGPSLSSLDPPSGPVTTATGNFDVTCGWYITGTKICHIEGSTPAIYHNGTSTASTGRINLAASSTLRVTGANCQLGANDLVSQTPLSFNVRAAAGGTGDLGPVIVRT